MTKVMDKQIIYEINKMKEAGIQCDVKPGQPLKGANRYKKLYHFISFNSFVKKWLSKKNVVFKCITRYLVIVSIFRQNSVLIATFHAIN